MGWWLISVLPYVLALLDIDRWIDLRWLAPLDILLKGFFLACSMVVLRRCGASPWWALLDLAPRYGTPMLIAVVCWYLGKRSERTAGPSSA